MEHWTSWIYHYGVGTVVAAICFFVAIRNDVISWSDPRDRRLVFGMGAGLALFASAHAAWIYVATR